jgi:predicted Zn-dependent protease
MTSRDSQGTPSWYRNRIVSQAPANAARMRQEPARLRDCDPAYYWYLFAAEAELELGHERAALDWALRANAFMPGSPLVQAWLASIYATIGDRTNAAKSVAALTKMAPGRTRLFMNRPSEDTNSHSGRHGPRIFDGLRLALRT